MVEGIQGIRAKFDVDALSDLRLFGLVQTEAGELRHIRALVGNPNYPDQTHAVDVEWRTALNARCFLKCPTFQRLAQRHLTLLKNARPLPNGRS